MQTKVATRTRNGDLFYTVKEVATLLGISLNTAYKYSRRKGVPVKRFGRNCIRFPKARFNEWAGIEE